MFSVFAPVAANHLRKSLATNSGPLSERRCSGTSFITTTSANAEITLALGQLRSQRISKHTVDVRRSCIELLLHRDNHRIRVVVEEVHVSSIDGLDHM